jgi:hypothetical protein
VLLSLPLAKSLVEFRKTQANTKLGMSPFHFINMGPLSDVLMSRRLCVTDFGHVMCSCHCRWPKVWQNSERPKPKPRLFAASTQNMELLNHFISSIWVQ